MTARGLFAITATVPRTGKIQHVIRAADQAAAWARFCRAYPGRACVLVGVRMFAGVRG